MRARSDAIGLVHHGGPHGESAARVVAGCEANGFTVVPTDTHYFIASVPDEWTSAAELRGVLLETHGIKVRDGASFGLPRHVRLAARTTTESLSVMQAIESITSAARTQR